MEQAHDDRESVTWLCYPGKYNTGQTGENSPIPGNPWTPSEIDLT